MNRSFWEWCETCHQKYRALSGCEECRSRGGHDQYEYAARIAFNLGEHGKNETEIEHQLKTKYHYPIKVIHYALRRLTRS